MTTQLAPTAARAPRGRRVRLDARKIVEAGLEVAEESASSTFSPKLLGEKLGVDPSAVYRHFRSKSHLMAALLDEVTSSVLARVDAPREAWRERVLQLASMTLEEFVLRPSIAAEAMVITTHGPGELGAVELLLDALTVCGLDEDEVVRHYAVISSYILSTASGFARAGSEEANAEPGDGGSLWFDRPMVADPAYPQVSRYAGRLATLDDSEIFMIGLEALLDSAERCAAG